jgi:hypothetical protein
MKRKEQRSPRGILVNQTYDSPEGFRLEQIGPNTFTQVRSTSAREAINRFIKFWHDFFPLIEEKADPVKIRIFPNGKFKVLSSEAMNVGPRPESLDFAAASRECRKQLARIENYLQDFDRAQNPSSLMEGLYHALLFASDVHQFTIIDNEGGIHFAAKRGRLNEERNLKKKQDAKRAQSTLQKLADPIWARNPRLSAKAVAQRIVKERPGWKVDTVRRRIRKK